MSTKTLRNVAADAPRSKLDATDYTKALWLEAYRMSRRMIRGSTPARGWCLYLEHARRRFGASGWRIAQAAGRAAFDARTAAFLTAGPVETLIAGGFVRRTAKPRPGNLVGVVVYRGARFERDRRYGFNGVWGYDPLASCNNPAQRRYIAKQRRALREACAADRLYVRASAHLTTCGREMADA